MQEQQAKTSPQASASSGKRKPDDYVLVALAYAEGALEDKKHEKHNKWIRLAAKRFMADLKRSQLASPPFVWSPNQANRACEFIEMLPHVEGNWGGADNLIRLEPAQVFFICQLFGFRRPDGSRRFTNALFAVARKNAKALALDTPIPTPTGWVKMGDIEIGDYVLGADGHACRVIGVSETFHENECYRLSFSNGESVVADAGHQWVTRARIDSANGCRVGNGKTRHRVRTTEEIAGTLLVGSRGDANHSLEMPMALQLSECDLPIDPYALGAWLGDGHSAGGRITCSKDDEQIIDEIRKAGYPIIAAQPKRGKAWCYSLSSGDKSQASRSASFTAQLRNLGVLNNKHIPAEYLRAGYAQRLSLLQGLMDTDGTISKSGRVLSYTGVNKNLVLGVAELLATFGIKYSWNESPCVCNGRVVDGTAYRLQFMTFSDEVPCFRLRRKLERMRRLIDCKIAPRSRTVQIVDAESVLSVPVRCIAVDSPNNLFLFGRSMLPTHNSTLAAAILLYCFCCEPEIGPQILSAATTGDQARIVWGVAQKMVKRLPDLCETFAVEAFANAIARYETGGTFKPINAKASTQDGLNPSALCFDELHAHKTRDLYDVLRSAAGARKNPLFLYTTTEGYENAGPWAEIRTFAQQVLDGLVEADHFLALYYGLDEDDDDFDESKWVKANPLLGVSVTLDKMREYASEAKQQPGSLAEFRIKRLNRRAQSAEGFIDLIRWRKCGGKVDLDAMQSFRCYAGLDLSSTRDMTAFALLWDVHGVWHAYVKYWVPDNAVEQRNERGTVRYAPWVHAGHIVITDGDAVDYDVIERDVLDLVQRFKPEEIAFDAWNAQMLCNNLMAQGLPMVEFVQGPKSYHPAMQALEKAYIEGRLAHGDNPVLNWNASNLIARKDVNNNMAPDKKRAPDKIDGIVALLMAFGRAVANVDDSPVELIVL